jgi:hypothetical protein
MATVFFVFFAVGEFLPSSIQYDYSKRVHKPTALKSGGKSTGGYTHLG